MPDPTARELKLIQYLNEAYGKEKQLETTLQAQIRIFQKPAIKKRLQDHLKETKGQSKALEKRIKALGGKAQTQDLPGPDITDAAAGAVANVANRALAAAKGPVQALRGTSGADNQLRNARDAYWNEAEEIAHYTIIEAAADQLGDKDTVKLARDHRRQEERMQTFLSKQMPQLVKDVIKEEIPAKERKPASSSASRSRSTSRSSSTKSTSAKSTSGKSSSRKSTAKTSSRGKSSASSNGRSASSRRTASRAKS
jgi:ferritin-like metal-binding protein YciE